MTTATYDDIKDYADAFGWTVLMDYAPREEWRGSLPTTRLTIAAPDGTPFIKADVWGLGSIPYDRILADMREWDATPR